MATETAGRKPDPTGPLIATLAPSRNCIGANAATSPLHKQKAREFPHAAFAVLLSRIYQPPVAPRALNTRGTFSAFRRLAVGEGIVVVQH
jgi:hypothetical protein